MASVMKLASTELIVHGTYSLEKWLTCLPLKEEQESSLLDDIGIGTRVRQCPERYGYMTIMTEEDTLTWMRYLPSGYSQRHEPALTPVENSEITHHIYGHKLWNEYAFDHIPHEALLLIQQAKNCNCFHNIYILTPELKIPDPLCCGRFHSQFYPIVRWGESLLPFREIKSIVARQQESQMRLKPQRLWQQLLVYMQIR